MSHREKSLLDLRSEHVPQGPFNVTPAFVKEARGAKIIDVDGRELIDFAGGIGVVNVGHCHPKVVEAIKDQAEKFIHTCFHVVMYEPYVELAKRLNELTPGNFPKMTMFANSGAEAVENAVKIARYATQKMGIICFDNAFHGRTLLAMSLTSKVKPYKLGFGPFAPEIYRMPFAYCYRCTFGLKYPDCELACASYLEDFFISYTAPENTAAVIAEPIQGEGGFVTPPPGYFQKLYEICKKHDVLLIIDEVQSAMGRTGTLFAIEHWGIEPDIIITAKSLAAGMPLSAITGRKELMDKPHVGGLGGTYGGNPIACRAALEVLDILLNDGLLDKAQKIGQMTRSRFEDMYNKYEIIGEVRGIGPMLAIELVKDRETKEPATDETKKLVQMCYEKGLVIMSCGNFGNVIRFLAPLVISDSDLDTGLSILEECIRDLNK